MTAARAVGAAYPLLLAAALLIAAGLWVSWRLQERRRAARAAERHARPHSTHVGTAQQDAAAIALAAVREQCEDWARPSTAVTHTSRVRDESVAGAAGLLLDLIAHHMKEQRR
ncbi:hypothetical protein ABZ508_02715 [Streptomyces lavendulocolor]|uniref:Uncharacterized protein n=1 Tax=Streptomyces lavendulocolor TaxID=67316 RepID=A0ABV2VZD5_9ACTN